MYVELDPSCSMEILLPKETATLFRPEDVCALESMVSAWAHLSDIGGVDSLKVTRAELPPRIH